MRPARPIKTATADDVSSAEQKTPAEAEEAEEEDQEEEEEEEEGEGGRSAGSRQEPLEVASETIAINRRPFHPHLPPDN